MLNRVTIEPVKETDLPSVEMLLKELMEVVTDAGGFDIENSTENCRILLKNSAHHMLVARNIDGVLGFVNFTSRRTILHSGPSGLIDELVVSKSSRGTGIGKQLILAVIDRCRELGCCEVEVSTEKSNIQARRFYKSCGFAEDAVLLEIDLGE